MRAFVKSFFKVADFSYWINKHQFTTEILLTRSEVKKMKKREK